MPTILENLNALLSGTLISFNPFHTPQAVAPAVPAQPPARRKRRPPTTYRYYLEAGGYRLEPYFEEDSL